MKTKDYVILGFRNLWRRKSRSFLTIFAVVIGALSIIIMLSLVIGAKNVATKQLESIDGLTLVSVSANSEMESSGNLLSTDSGDGDSEMIINDSDIVKLKNIQNVVDATPLIGIWVKSVKLQGQEKRYRANILAYDTGSQVLKINPDVGRSLKKGDMDKVVIGIGLVKSLGYTENPEDLIGKNLVLYVEGGYTDWEADPPKPPEGDNKDYWENLQKPREITAEIIGIVSNGPDESQNYITLDWARKLMTQKEWKWDDEKRKQMEQTRNSIEQQVSREWESKKQQLYAGIKNDASDEERKEVEQNYRNEMETEIQKRMTTMGYNQTNFLTLIKHDMLSERGYGSILVRVDSTENVEKVGEEIKKLGYGSQTAKQMLDEIEKIFNLVGLIIGTIGGIVLFVASLGIINTMVMATYERTREIGVMRACGATRKDIRNLFVFEAGIIGFMGGLIGLGVSYGLAKIGNTIGNQIALSEGIPINNLISFPLWLIVSVIGITTIVGILAGLFPAIRASHLDPVEALRSE